MTGSHQGNKDRFQAKVLLTLILTLFVFPSQAYTQDFAPEICQLELMANHIEYQGDLHVGCEFSFGRVDVSTTGT
jgi:hypothetical protein